MKEKNNNGKLVNVFLVTTIMKYNALFITCKNNIY